MVAEYSKVVGIPFVESNIGNGAMGYYNYSDINILPLICSDSLNKIEIEKKIKNVDVLVVALNEVSILNSNMRLFHELIDRATAKMYGVPIIRSSNGGYSSFIDSSGYVVDRLPIGSGFLSMEIQVTKGSFYKENLGYINAIKSMLIVFVLVKLAFVIFKVKIRVFFKSFLLVSFFICFFCLIIQQDISGFDDPPKVVEELSPYRDFFYSDPNRMFIYRQMGVPENKVKEFLDVKYMNLSQKTDTLGVGYMNTVYGYILILEVNDEYVMVVFGDTVLPVSKKALQNIVVGKLVWFDYKNRNNS